MRRTLLTVLVSVLCTALAAPPALAEFPYPRRNQTDERYDPGKDPNDIRRGGGANKPPDGPGLPGEGGSKEYWEYSSKDACQLYITEYLANSPPSTPPHPKAVNCNPAVVANPQEQHGVTGASVDRAWETTTGTPQVIIAVHDSGVMWDDRGAMLDLINKTWLNFGELPAPGWGTGGDDANGDGILNIEDFCPGWDSENDCGGSGAPAIIGDPNSADTDYNATGYIDPEDLIFKFSNGVDDDGNGYIDDFVGWDSYEDDNDPYDEVGYGHGTGEAEDSTAETNNNNGMAGVCPNCMVMHMRVGDSFIADVNDFAQGVLYATDNGASVIQSALGTLNSSRFAQEAIDYAYRRGVVLMASAADESAGHHNQPSVLEHGVTMNSIGEPQGIEGSPSLQPPSYLEFRGCTNYGAYIVAAVPSNSCSSEAVGRSAGMAGLAYSAAREALGSVPAPVPTGLPSILPSILPSTQPSRSGFQDYGLLDGPGGVPVGWGISAEEMRQLISTTADDLNFTKPLPYTDRGAPGTKRYGATEGWDPFFGYGRINARRMVEAIARNEVPPEADITSPEWFEIVDPDQASVDIKGRVASLRTPGYSYKLEWAVWSWKGPERNAYVSPAYSSAGVIQRATGHQTAPISGTLGSISSTAIKAALTTANTPVGAFSGPAVEPATGRGEHENVQLPDKFGIIARVVVTAEDASGAVISTERRAPVASGNPNANAARPLVGIATKNFNFHDDPALFAGYPRDMEGDGAAAPRFADLNDDGVDELIVATSNGAIHAYKTNGDELAGWPVTTADMQLNYQAAAYRSGEITTPVHAAVLRSPAVGDLDRDGDLEVVAGDFMGRVSAWDKKGVLLPGFPVRSNPVFSSPQKEDREAGFYGAHPELVPGDYPGPGGLPNDPDLVPDLVNRRGKVPFKRPAEEDNVNRTIWWMLAAPTIANMDSSDADLEILAGSADRHMYAFHSDGSPVRGWPVILRDPAKQGADDFIDPASHMVNQKNGRLMGAKIINSPAVGDTHGDDKELEIYATVNEQYDERVNTDDPAVANLCGLGGGGQEIAVLQDCGNNRLYALHRRGSANGSPTNAGKHPNDNAFLTGWPARIASVQQQLLPVVGNGPDGSPILGNVNGGGDLEVGIFGTAGPAYILNKSGRSIYGRDEQGRDRTLLVKAFGAASNSKDTPTIPALGGGIFSTIGPGKLTYVAPSAGLGKLLDVVLPEDQLLSDNHLSIWELTQPAPDQPGHRSQLPAFPREVNDLQFLTTAVSADIDGAADGQEEVLEGSAYSDLHAFSVTGDEPGMKTLAPTGWPKFTGGWTVSPPGIGDFDDDGKRDLALVIREGTLFVWKGNGAGACAAATWPDVGHDQWNTNNVETDATRPRVITDLSVRLSGDGRQAVLEWTAPGDDGRCGTAQSYEARRSSRRLDTDSFMEGTPLDGEPTPTVGGTRQTMTVARQCEETFVAIRTWDANPERNDPASPNYNPARPANVSGVNEQGSNVAVVPRAPEVVCASPSGSSPSGAGPTASSSPSSSVTPSSPATPTGGPAANGSVSTTIAPSKRRVRFMQPLTLSGVVSGSTPCVGPYEVTIERRLHGREAFTMIKSVTTDADGDWQVELRPRRNSAYRAGVEPRPRCDGELSSPTDVQVRVKVKVLEVNACRWIRGRVSPPNPRTFVHLQKWKQKRWNDADQDRLSRSSRFRLPLPRCNGPVYRVVWRAQSVRNIFGASRGVRP